MMQNNFEFKDILSFEQSKVLIFLSKSMFYFDNKKCFL